MLANGMRGHGCAAGGGNNFKWRGSNRTLLKVGTACAALLISPASQATSEPSAVAASAPTGTIDLPPSGRGEGRTYWINFSSSEDKLRKLVLDHKARCEALHLARCRVEEFSPDDSFDGPSMQLVLRLAPGQAQLFIDDIGKATLDSGFTVRRDQPDAHRYDGTEENQLRIVLLEVQKQKLEALKVGATEARLVLIQRNLSRFETELAGLRLQLAQQARPPETEKLTISYSSNKGYLQSRSDRQLHELSGMFWTSLLVVTGVAVLTGIYFGIIALALLGLKRLAIKIGLLPGSAEAKTTLPDTLHQAARRPLPVDEARDTPPA